MRENNRQCLGSQEKVVIGFEISAPSEWMDVPILELR